MSVIEGERLVRFRICDLYLGTLLGLDCGEMKAVWHVELNKAMLGTDRGPVIIFQTFSPPLCQPSHRQIPLQCRP